MLVKLTLLSILFFFIYATKNLYIYLLKQIITVATPILIAFTIAYILYPSLQLLNKKFKKQFSIAIIYFLIMLIILTITLNIIKITTETNQLLNSIELFLQNILIKYELDLSSILEIIQNILINNLKIFNIPLKVVSIFKNIILIIFISAYFLYDMEKIIKKITTNQLINNINIELRNYFKGFTQIIFITFIEYAFFFKLINHPFYLLIAFIAAIANIIPIFGNIITIITAYILVFNMPEKIPIVILTSIICLIIDNFIINPLIYSKNIKISPLIIIIIFIIASSLFKTIGIFLSLPIFIIISEIYKYITNKRDIIKKVIK